MKFAFAMPHLLRLKATGQPWERAVTGPDQQRLARHAERLGYDMISVPEHFVIPASHVELSGPHHFHAAAAQGFFAGATERIRINSSIAILPLQHPIVTAKALSTVDWQSGGRVIATFGVGWLKKEFDLLGVDFAARGRMADDYLAAIIELWTSDDPVFDGEFVSFRDERDELVERLSWFAELGVTMSAVPIPPVTDVDEYLDYAQWVIEEVKPRVPRGRERLVRRSRSG